jgi:hypothetical protein
MRRFIKLWPGATSSEASGFQQLLTADESEATGSPFWLGLRTKRDFVDVFNERVEIGGFSNVQILATYEIIPWVFAAVPPDFSGYRKILKDLGGK